MKSAGYRLLWSFLFFFLFFVPVSAQYLDISSVLDTWDLQMEWNPLTGSGHLYQDGTRISFKTGISFLIVDYQKKINIRPLIRDKNRLLVHQETVETLQQLFSQQKQEKHLTGQIAVIILDPGHGGKDPGAVGSFMKNKEKVTIYEKDVVLKVALKLENLLKARYPEKRIILTRGDDHFPSLETRSDIANNVDLDMHDAILFISLHTNSGFNPRAQGFEVWHLPANYRRTVIDTEKADPLDAEILPILNTMLEEEYLIESIKLAGSISEGLEEQVGDVSPNRGLKEEAWYVVRKSNMPSILIELGFVSNQDEALRLSTESYLNKLVMGIYNGIIDFTTTFESVKGFGD